MVDQPGNAGPPKRPNIRREVIGVLEVLIYVAGVSIALAITLPILKAPYDGTSGDPIAVIPVVVRLIVVILGGVSFAGVPLLLRSLKHHKIPWGPGKMAWFAQGMAAWLLWPPIVGWQVTARSGGSEMPWSAVCWFWGTPLMGVYVAASLLAGGWFGRRGRRRARRSGREQFGIVLACLWALTGLYMLSLLYWIDLLRNDG